MEKKNNLFYFLKPGFFLVIFLLFPQFIASQDIRQGIRGRVRDGATFKYLESVNLIIAGTSYGTSSKPDGSFDIAGIPEGKYELQASMVGYHSVSRIVTISRNSFTNILINLKPKVVLIDSVGVMGRRKHNYMSAPTLEPLSLDPVISTVTRLNIEKQGAISLIDAIKYVPGALTETRGRKVKHFFSVRGQKYPYPDYAINGIWQREFHEMPYFFSASDIEEVEIIRSSAALLTGLSGLVGVINIKTRKYDKPETSAELEYGTFNTLHFHASHGARYNKISYAAGVGYDKTNGPDQKNAAEGIGNLFCRVNWQPVKELVISTNLYYLDGKRELALGEEPAGKRFREEISSFNQVRSTLSNLKVNYRPNEKSSTEVQVYYTDRKPKFKREDINTGEIIKTSEKDHEWGINFIQALSLSQKNILRFGGLYNHWIAPNGKRFYVGRPCDLETISGVVADEFNFGSFTLDGGIRWSSTYMNEYGAFNINGSGKLFSTVTPVIDEWQPANLQFTLGFTWNLTKNWSVFHHSATGKIKPREGSLDDNLVEPQNETRTKFDLGIQTSWKETGKITLTGFLVNQKNAIVYSGETFEQNGIILELYKNRDEDHFGFEVEALSPELFNLFSAFVNFTAMRSRAEEDGQMKKNTEFPEIIFNGGILIRRSGIDFNLYWKYVSKFESSRFITQIQGEPTIYAPLGDYFALDISTGYTFGSTVLTRIYLKIQNLTDKRFSTVAGYPDFGRRINFGLRTNF
jgi:outer membrane receptor protein involved in Fe transport